MPAFAEWVREMPSWGIDGPIQLAHSIVCSFDYWVNLRGGDGGGSETKLDCTESLCALDGADYGGEYAPISRRSLAPELVKRITDYSANLGNGQRLTITQAPYLPPSRLDGNDPLFNEAMTLVDIDDCGNARITADSVPNGEYFQVEHLVEGQMIRDFIEDAAAGRLASGATAQTGGVAASFFIEARTMPLPNPPPIPEALDDAGLWHRVMHALGSSWNRANFLLLQEDLNSYKGCFSAPPSPYNKDETVISVQPMQTQIIIDAASDTTRVSEVISAVRASITTVRYLDFSGTPNVNQRLSNVINLVGGQLEYAQNLHNNQNPNNQVQILEFWREWIRDFYGDTYLARVRSFVDFCRKEINKF